jgi:hypothetical protein
MDKLEKKTENKLEDKLWLIFDNVVKCLNQQGIPNSTIIFHLTNQQDEKKEELKPSKEKSLELPMNSSIIHNEILQNNVKPFVAVLVLSEGEEANIVVWRFAVTEQEYDLLAYEVSVYNDWVSILACGLAPNSSYDGSNDSEELFLAKRMVKRDNSYSGQFERPGSRDLYEQIHLTFTLFKHGIEHEDIDEEDLEKINSLESSSFNELIHILSSPLCRDEELTIGYRILPITNKIIKRNLPSLF